MERPAYLNGKSRGLGDLRKTEPCPRCRIELLPLGYPGAISRYDNKTEICPLCGLAEAFEKIPKEDS